MANEAFARVKIDQLLKDADWSLSGGRSVRFGSPSEGGDEAGGAPHSCRGDAFATLKVRRASVNPSAGGTRKAHCANA